MSIMEGKRDVLAECKAKLETTLKVNKCSLMIIASRSVLLPNI